MKIIRRAYIKIIPIPRHAGGKIFDDQTITGSRSRGATSWRRPASVSEVSTTTSIISTSATSASRATSVFYDDASASDGFPV